MSETVGRGTEIGVRRTARSVAASALVVALGITALHLWIRYDPPMWWLFQTRGHWIRTQADMRDLSIALTSYAKDNVGRLPVAAGDVEQLRAILEPTYLKELPSVDGWGQPFIYRSDGSSYELRSRGRDCREDPAGEVVRRVDQDLTFRDGAFVENDLMKLLNSPEMHLE